MRKRFYSPRWLAALLVLGPLTGGLSACGGGTGGDEELREALADSVRRIADVIIEELKDERPVEPTVEPPVGVPPEPPDVPLVQMPSVGPDEPPVGPPDPPVDDPPVAPDPPETRFSGKLTLICPAHPMYQDCTKPTYWETEEYRKARGLQLINASEGYGRLARDLKTPIAWKAPGRAVTVMVLDTGVDFSHPDLRAFGDHYDFHYADEEPSRGHGTEVAGVIAALKNDEGLHGVAYAARIVSFGTCLGGEYCIKRSVHSSQPNVIAAGIASAAGLNRTYYYKSSNPNLRAHIINMSLGGANYSGYMASAMREAAAAGRIMVAALGNDYGHIGPPGSPAVNVTDPGIAGYAIAVGSLNYRGTGRAAHSNTCGPVAEYCLFAPGERIPTTKVAGGYTWSTGTSFAAPHVSGAAAVVWSAFPYRSAEDIVQRLLTTARPMTLDQRLAKLGLASGVSRIDEEFGWGALDLGAALAPIIRGRGLTIAGSMVPVDESYVELPLGFTSPARFAALTNTIVYDAMMFPFYYDLAASFRASESGAGGMLHDFLSSLGAWSNVSLGRTDASLHFVHDEEASDLHWNALEEDRDEELDVYRFSLAPAPGVTVTIGQGFGSIGSSNEFIAARTNRTIFGDGFSVAPFATLAGRGPGVTVGWQTDDGTSIDLVGKTGQGYGGTSSAQLASLGLTQEIADGVTLGARYGMLRETGSLMGIRTAGAFASAGHARTDFVDVSMEGRVSDDLTLFGSVSQGITGSGTRGAKNSLVSEWSAARAGSFVIGTEFEHFLQDSDRLTLTASSPFRADRATLHLDVPDREVADQVVDYSRRSIDLVPGGREHRVQWVYEMNPGASWLGDGRDAVSLAIGGYVRLEPHHDESADPEYGAAVKVRATF